MILIDFLRALGQIGDPRFRAVLLRGVGLAILLLAGVTAAALLLIGTLGPDRVTLPWIGPVGGLEWLFGGAFLLAMIVLSVFLMVPVAVLFTSLYLERVAEAVEARHYPGLPAARRQGWGEIAADTAVFFVILALVNIAALAVYLFAGPLVPVLFWVLNGYLLGRELFQLVALRRLDREAAGRLRRRHGGQIWMAGILMAAPLSVPLVNLVVPILGVATFTHVFHRLSGAAPSAHPPGRVAGSG